MTFWEHFFRVLGQKPIPALAALYWHLTRRRVRARNRLRVASADLPFAYALWIANNERHPQNGSDLEAMCDAWTIQPRFCVIIHSGQGRRELVEQSRASLERQVYRNWALADDGTIPPGADFIVPLKAGDRLSPTALLRFAEAVQATPAAAVFYGDEDRMDDRGRRSKPWFKPKWNEELFLAQDYLSSAAAIRSGLVIGAPLQSGNDLAALLLNATDREELVVHVPYILVHVADAPNTAPDRLTLVSRRVARRAAVCSRGPFSTIKVEWPLPDPAPFVSVIIPTKDKLDVLRPCVESLLARTDYPRFEILIVNNGSVEPGTLHFFGEMQKDERVKVLDYDRPFNYSAINNFAVTRARGQFLSLLNNDTEVLEPKWLVELMRYAARPEIGAAGAKLLYDDRSIQHAGVVVGIGEAAGHPHRNLAEGSEGYFRMAHSAQFVSAVTGACLLVEKSKFEAVGGFDEQHLAVAYNDVDLCLKLQAAGWRNVYVPHAVLLHHESRSRPSDMAPSQLERYRRELKTLQERWGTKTYEDPLHNRNLDRYSETYVFRL